MAILINRLNGRRIVLMPQHVFGRNRTCSTVLDNTDASRLHASIRWEDDRWELRDHSRNGTFLDGRRAPQNSAVVLKAGQSLLFGLDGSPAWLLQDLSRPGPILLPVDGGDPIALSHSNLLPDASNATVCIVLESNGRWQCTMEGGSRVLLDGEEVLFGGRRWTFHAGTDSQITQEVGGRLAAISLPCAADFNVSLNEEHVQLRITYGDRVLEMGERAHHYALLTLARIRMEEAGRGLGLADQGWVEHARLAKMLGLDAGHLNIQIFRLRQQVAQALGRNLTPPELIERRRGEVRLGALVVNVKRGSLPPISFFPDAVGQRIPQRTKTAETADVPETGTD